MEIRPARLAAAAAVPPGFAVGGVAIGGAVPAWVAAVLLFAWILLGALAICSAVAIEVVRADPALAPDLLIRSPNKNDRQRQRRRLRRRPT